MATATKTDPAVSTGTATALVAALISLVVSFGLPITNDQTVAILAVVGIAAPLVSGYLTRRKVTPDDRVLAKIDKDTGEFVAGKALEDIPTGDRVELRAEPSLDGDLPY